MHGDQNIVEQKKIVPEAFSISPSARIAGQRVPNALHCEKDRLVLETIHNKHKFVREGIGSD
jgi:hypothetical protein